MLYNFDFHRLYIYHIQMNKDNNYFYLDIVIHYKIIHIDNFLCHSNIHLDIHININF